jgi:hypothetical protein
LVAVLVPHDVALEAERPLGGRRRRQQPQQTQQADQQQAAHGGSLTDPRG